MYIARKGTLFIVSAPSGAGKTSLVNKVVKQLQNIIISISYTTRAKRARERHGKHYYFVNEETFLTMIKQDAFIEHAKVFGNFYGTSRLWLAEQLNKGNDVILEIDWQGAMQISSQFSNLISIFILPPSLAILKERLVTRKQDSHEIVQQRISQAVTDITKYKNYDYVIINDSFKCAAEEMIAIIRARRVSLSANSESLQGFVDSLLVN